jgi:hypothetical protein
LRIKAKKREKRRVNRSKEKMIWGRKDGIIKMNWLMSKIEPNRRKASREAGNNWCSRGKRKAKLKGEARGIRKPKTRRRGICSLGLSVARSWAWGKKARIAEAIAQAAINQMRYSKDSRPRFSRNTPQEPDAAAGRGKP